MKFLFVTNNKTALQIAIEESNLAIVDILLSKKELDVNAKSISFFFKKILIKFKKIIVLIKFILPNCIQFILLFPSHYF